MVNLELQRLFIFHQEFLVHHNIQALGLEDQVVTMK